MYLKWVRDPRGVLLNQSVAHFVLKRIVAKIHLSHKHIYGCSSMLGSFDFTSHTSSRSNAYISHRTPIFQFGNLAMNTG